MLRALEISTGSTLDTLSTPTISDVCTAGTACCTRGSVVLYHTPILGPSVLVLLILLARAVFRTPHTRVLQYGFNTLDTLSTLTISDVCTAGTACCTRGSVVLYHTPSIRSIWAFSTRTAHTPSTRSI